MVLLIPLCTLVMEGKAVHPELIELRMHSLALHDQCALLLIPLCTLVMEGKAVHPELDEDGNVKWNPSGKFALIIVQIIRWLGFLLLYVGTICVMVGAYTMTPETANGRGSVPLADQTPFAGEPVGPNDLPGVPNR